MNSISRKVGFLFVFAILVLVLSAIRNVETVTAVEQNLTTASELAAASTAPTLRLVEMTKFRDNTGVFGASSFDWEILNENRTFSGKFRARAADVSLLGCLFAEDCNWFQILSSLIDLADFSKGEQWLRGLDLRLEGDPGTRAVVLVESNLDGLLATGHAGLAGSIAHVQAELYVQPTSGVRETVCKYEHEIGTGTPPRSLRGGCSRNQEQANSHDCRRCFAYRG